MSPLLVVYHFVTQKNREKEAIFSCSGGGKSSHDLMYRGTQQPLKIYVSWLDMTIIAISVATQTAVSSQLKAQPKAYPPHEIH